MLKFTRLIALAAVVAAAASCGSVVRNGSGPVFLVIDSLEGSRGGVTAGTPTSGTLSSDVLTEVTTPAPCTPDNPCPTHFSDGGQATLHASPKDVTLATAPSSNNDVTITRYHVAYVRTDGRNTEGVDVPYAFDGAATGTLTAGSGSLTLGFELVQALAKQQAPLAQLVNNTSNVLSVIANVTFYGHDQVGNELNVTGSISIDFANYGG